MHAIALLKEQHKRIGTLFRRVAEADQCTKQTHFDALVAQLLLHTELEERCFYPTVRARRTEDVLLESLQEHWIMKRVLDQLFELPVQGSAFDARLRVLHELIESHFEEEENELFAKVARGFDKPALEALGEELQRFAAQLAAERDEQHRAGTLTEHAAHSASFRDSRLQR
jgi:hemerythrin-like domain-containing protein